MSLIENFDKNKNDLAKKLIENKKITQGLKLYLDEIIYLLDKNLGKIEIKNIIEKELNVTIKDQSFYAFTSKYANKKGTTKEIKNVSNLSKNDSVGEVVEDEDKNDFIANLLNNK